MFRCCRPLLPLSAVAAPAPPPVAAPVQPLWFNLCAPSPRAPRRIDRSSVIRRLRKPEDESGRPAAPARCHRKGSRPGTGFAPAVVESGLPGLTVRRPENPSIELDTPQLRTREMNHTTGAAT